MSLVVDGKAKILASNGEVLAPEMPVWFLLTPGSKLLWDGEKVTVERP